jgi:acyl dehydratase
VRYLRLGEVLAGVQEVVEVSDEKKTALGVGHFVTTQTTYTVSRDEIVGRMRFRVLKFKPGTGRAPGVAAPAGDAPGSGLARAARRETTLRASEVGTGQTLAPCPLPITATRIVAGAIASRDYQDVHHDRELAQRRGSPDIFMNILTTSGIVARFATDWAGPEALLRSLTIRLGAPNYPGDTLVLRGSVARASGGELELSLRGDNRLGAHVTGSVTLSLPAS